MSKLSRTLIIATVSFVSLVTALPARAGMLHLVCKFPPHGGAQAQADVVLEINLTNGMVNDRFATFPATISATSIHYRKSWEHAPEQHADVLIDRTTGVIEWTSEFAGGLPQDPNIGHCAVSKAPRTTKF